jgi:hypothetical protein
MLRIFFCHTMENHYIEYYLEQASQREARNKYYNEKILQKGAGVGGAFSSVYRYLKPFIASGLDVLKEESIKTAADLILGISSQKPMKEILTDRSVEMVDRIRDTAVKKINTMAGGSLKKPLKRTIKRKLPQYEPDSDEESTQRTRKNKKKKKVVHSDIFE